MIKREKKNQTKILKDNQNQTIPDSQTFMHTHIHEGRGEGELEFLSA